MKIIKQGKPNSPYFQVTQPETAEVPEKGEPVKCVHPRTGNVTTGVVMDWFTYAWQEIPDSICLSFFGVNTLAYRKGLTEAHPEFKDQERVRILLILETKQ